MVFIILVSIYSALILVLAFGFARLEEPIEKRSGELLFISVIIPVRNEASTIPILLRDLSQITYPSHKWELIVVDDHSSDNLRLPDVRVIPSPFPGKKSAITAGVAAASGEIIITTDADCRVQPGWLHEINSAFQKTQTKMVVGAVRIEEDGSFFSRLQSIEFVSVVATGAATLGLGIPTMCNGANLAYRKDAFMQVDGYQGNENISSGDDEFLMNKFNHKWKNSISFLYSKSSVVTTTPSPNLAAFIQQRLRWAGKWKHNISFTTRVFAMVVWLFHLTFLIMPFAAVAGFLSWKLFIILAGTKIFVESLFLIPAANVLNVKWRWISFFVLQLVYSVYVLVTGLTSQLITSKWKGREALREIH